MNILENIGEKMNLTIENIKENNILQEAQEKFLQSNLGKAINSGVDIGIKALLPNFIEDEVINIKDSLVTDGFKAAVDTAIDEATNLGKSLMGIVSGTFENVSQIKEATEKGGLIDSISDLLDDAISFAKKQEWISKDTANLLKKGKKAIVDTVEEGIDNTLSKQIEAVEKIDNYIEKWQKYYEEQNFTNMEYQYNKIQEYLEEVIPLEETITKARTIENLHELIKNNGKNFELTEQQKELATILAN